MQLQENLKRILVYHPTFLPFESLGDYRQLENAIRAHFSPRDILEEMWTSEIVAGEWESARLRRYKDQIIKSAKPAALRSLLQFAVSDDELDELVDRWFTNKSVRKRVESLLRNVDLDAVAIDVEAYRLSIGDVSAIDRRLTELARRRDKIFRLMEDYRAGVSAPVSSCEGSRGITAIHSEDA